MILLASSPHKTEIIEVTPPRAETHHQNNHYLEYLGHNPNLSLTETAASSSLGS